MKTKFLFNPGIGWSGTTPFYYTLRNAKFCHAGYKKEFHYLQMMHLSTEDFQQYMIKKYTDTEKSFRTGEEPEKTAEYDIEHYKALLEAPHSFDKYIYHMQYMKDMFPDYHAVCDFSNFNIALPEEFLTAHAKALAPYFDVKVTMIVADPVFRYYHELGGVINTYHSKKMPQIYKNEDMLYDHYVRTKQQQKLFRWCVERSRFSTNCYYEKNFDKLARSYGNKNVLVLEMEKIWDSSYHNETFDKLSHFLDYEIKPEHLYPNQYMSEHKDIEGLRDQNTEIEPLTEELYKWGVDRL
jgi:hypothetical protein|tara:strand:- start:65 stop:952 length:888 start_codon:yes stop_codon:yes gene_type:complete